MLLPAIRPDLALFHPPWPIAPATCGSRTAGTMVMAHAARLTLVTVEEITDEDLLADDRTAAGTIPALYVTAIADVERGAWPIALRGHYSADAEHLRLYAEQARTPDGFQRYLQQHVLVAPG